MGLYGGGSGGGGETKFEYNDLIKPYMTDYLAHSTGDAKAPYTNYTQTTGRDRTAPINSDQQEGMGYTRAMARQMSSPVDVLNQTRTTLNDTLSGNYLDSNRFAQGQANPWTGLNPTVQQNQYGAMQNQWGSAQVTPSANPSAGAANAYAGMDSPYFRDMVHNAQDDITAAYQHGTAADTNRMFAQSGAYGGSAHAQAVQNNQTALAKQLGVATTGMFGQQYDRSAGLDESRLGRQFQGGESLAGRDLEAQTFNKQIGSQLTENSINRQNANQEAFIGRDLQNQQANKQAGLQSWEQGQDRGSTGYMNERGNMMGALAPAQNEQGLAYQRIGGVMGIGDFQRGVDQQYSDENYNNWFDQNNYNRNMDSWLGGIYSGAMGGLPPNQMSSMPSSGLANTLGGALAAYGMFRA